MKVIAILLASFMFSAPAIARSDYRSHDECYKLQTEWFDAIVSVCNKFRADKNDDLKASVCPHYAMENGYPNWASYREVAIASRTKECTTLPRIR